MKKYLQQKANAIMVRLFGSVPYPKSYYEKREKAEVQKPPAKLKLLSFYINRLSTDERYFRG